jgi:hypothetical protein
VYGWCQPGSGAVIDQWLDGPFLENAMCCYHVYTSCCCGQVSGRPLVVAGEHTTAPLSEDDARWCAELGAAALEGLDAATRATLAERWVLRALDEHASIASFARATLELLAAGAPPELVDATQAAARDEIEHARLCFALASRYRARNVSAGALPLGELLPLRRSLADIAEAAAVEGCIGETLAAALAHEELARASDPEVRRVLAILFADETRHAELAWRTVAWAVRAGGEPVRRRVAAAFASALSAPFPAADPEADSALAAHGVLDAGTTRAVHVRTLRAVIGPCARALCAPPASLASLELVS